MPSQDEPIKFDQGILSGYVSALLGILSLAGVFCFYFPELLTAEEFRKSYTVEFARWALFTTLIISYFMGVVSFVLNKSKKLAIVGILTSLVATLMGGTFKCPKGQWPAEYGIVSGKPPKGIFKQFLHPFIRKKKKPKPQKAT